METSGEKGSSVTPGGIQLEPSSKSAWEEISRISGVYQIVFRWALLKFRPSHLPWRISGARRGAVYICLTWDKYNTVAIIYYNSV